MSSARVGEQDVDSDEEPVALARRELGGPWRSATLPEASESRLDGGQVLI